MNIKIRSPDIQDCDLFINAMIDSKDYHAPWTTAPTTEEQYKDYLLKYRSDNNKSFLILYNDNIAGVVNLNEIVYGAFKSAYLGYYGVKQFASSGIMQQGMRLVIEHAFSNMGLHRLEANIQPNNIKSINLVKKLGFSKEGFSPRYLYINNQWCDHERWAIVAENCRTIDDSEMFHKINQPNFEFRRRVDNVIYLFQPSGSINGHLSWKREDLDLWITQVDGFGWVCVDSERNICGIPWEIVFDKMTELPPEGEWISKKGDKAYVYDLFYK